MHLCPFCRTQNELYGVEWNERDIHGGEAGDVAADQWRVQSASTMGELSGHRLRPSPKRSRASVLLRNREVRELVHYRDYNGWRRGWYTRARLLSRREIARSAGCSHTYVNRIFRESICGDGKNNM
jgi:hypothetical protein